MEKNGRVSMQIKAYHYCQLVQVHCQLQMTVRQRIVLENRIGHESSFYLVWLLTVEAVSAVALEVYYFVV